LEAALQALRHGDDSKFVFDEGEQGQPAFVFERAGDVLLLAAFRARLVREAGAFGEEWWRTSVERDS